jgi:PAS domain S-box-containing protein
MPALVLLTSSVFGQAAAAAVDSDLEQLAARIAERTTISPEEKQWLATAPTIRFRASDIPPYCFDASNPKGLAVDYARVICRAYGIRFEVIPYEGIPFTDILVRLGSSAGPDVVLSARRNAARENHALFSRDYLFSPWVILTRDDNAAFIGSQRDLAGKRVAVEKGYLIGEKLRADVPDIRFVEVISTPEALGTLAAGKVDAYVGNLIQATFLLAQMGLSNIKVAAPTSYRTQGEAMMVRKDWPALVSLIDKALLAMTVEEKQLLRNRWLSIRYEYGIPRTLGLGLSAAVLVLLAFLAMTWWWNRRLRAEMRVRRQSETALRESERRFRGLFEDNHAVMLLVDPKSGSVVDANPAAVSYYGWSREELLRRNISEINTLSPEEIAAEMRAASENRRHLFHFRHRRADGSIRDVEISTSCVPFGDRQLLHSIVHDITARKQAEEQNNLLRQTINGHNDGAYWMDVDNRFVFVNDTACRVLGYAREELIGQQVELVSPLATAERMREVWVGFQPEKHLAFETVHRRKDGSEFPVEIMSTCIEHDGRRFICGFARDISGRKAIEAQLLQAQRMEAVGTLASGIAHDLNNILAPMLMVSGLLKDKLPDEQDQEMLAILQNEARRGGEIIKQLLTYSRGMEGQRKLVQPRYAFKELMAMLRETFPREIDLRLQLAKDLWPIFADPTQLHQLAMNLCVNARDAMPRGGHLTFSASNLDVLAGHVALPASAQPGPYVLIEVADSGHGILPEIRDRIFDPFFTTKAFGKGTGLGLATVLGIARSHGGFVTVESTPGQGSVFRVFLPALPGEGTAESSESRPAPQPGQGQLILVVDDERNIRESTRIALQRHGFSVEMAVNGEDALAQYRRNRERIRLVVTDVMMPTMGGVAFIRQLRELNAKLPIVVTSGLTDDTSRAELAELDVAEFLMKPLDVSSLLAAVQRGLSRNAATER